MISILPGHSTLVSSVRLLLLLPAILLAACAVPVGPAPPTPAPPRAADAPLTDATSPAAVAAALREALIAAEARAKGPPAPIPIDPILPKEPLDLNDRSAQTDLWARVRRGFAMPDLNSDLVRNREQWYASRPDYVQRMTERGGRYLYHIVLELERRGMPTELALLPFIESAFNPHAMSTARASGMWQFIPSTGKDFSLRQNVFRDDRRDVLASTRAALDYLKKLHGMFGDWHLALAAYNWGEGSVQRAIVRNQKAGLPTDYSSLRMPNETQYYVPKLQAVKNIVSRPSDFGLSLPPLRNHPYFLSVPIERDMDVDVAVKLAGIPLAEFQSLNPQMNKPVILAAGTPQVLLPYDNADLFVRQLPLHRGPLATWTAWIAPKTLSPADAAMQVGMSETQLREVNRIPPRMLVKAGSTLLVPRSQERLTDVSIEIADNGAMALSPLASPLRKLSLKAGQRDSVASVAKRYRVSPGQVAEWNSVTSSSAFRPGQTIVVFVAAQAVKSARAAGQKPSGHPSTRTTMASRDAAGQRGRATVRPRAAGG